VFKFTDFDLSTFEFTIILPHSIGRCISTKSNFYENFKIIVFIINIYTLKNLCRLNVYLCLTVLQVLKV